MSGSVWRSALCDPKQHISELWLPKAESNVGKERKLCKRHVNIMKTSTKSEIDISSFDKKQSQRRCQAKAETKPTSAFCRQKPTNLLKSKSSGMISAKLSGDGMKKSTDPKVSIREIWSNFLSPVAANWPFVTSFSNRLTRWDLPTQETSPLTITKTECFAFRTSIKSPHDWCLRHAQCPAKRASASITTRLAKSAQS